MSPFRRKAVENALAVVLRDRRDVTWTLKAVRPFVGELVDGCTPAELAAAVQSLRYQGKLSWDRLALSPSMLAGEEPAPGSAIAPIAAEEGTAAAKSTSPSSGPDDDDDYPGEVNDTTGAGNSAALAGPAEGASSPSPVHGFVPRRLLHQAGISTAITRAGARPVPVPEHEPEVGRQVREEVEQTMLRRRRATSTATVSQPLELRKFGVPDLNFAEGMQSLLAETPHDLMAAIARRHVALWRRVILLGRARGERPAEALYAALEAGLQQLEEPTATDERDAA